MRQLSILLNHQRSRATQCDIFRGRTQVALDLARFRLSAARSKVAPPMAGGRILRAWIPIDATCPSGARLIGRSTRSLSVGRRAHANRHRLAFDAMLLLVPAVPLSDTGGAGGTIRAKSQGDVRRGAQSLRPVAAFQLLRAGHLPRHRSDLHRVELVHDRAGAEAAAYGLIEARRSASPKSAAGAVKARKKTVSVVFQNQRDVALGKPGGANGRDWILVRRRE
jgi:hypothetical protein